LKTWEVFTRELKISFCHDSGDFFAPDDSLAQHSKNPPAKFGCTPEKADVKRRETQKAHNEFRVRLERLLRTGKNIRNPISQIIEDKYLKEAH
jgi:hypothetical protein